MRLLLLKNISTRLLDKATRIVAIALNTGVSLRSYVYALCKDLKQELELSPTRLIEPSSWGRALLRQMIGASPYFLTALASIWIVEPMVATTAGRSILVPLVLLRLVIVHAPDNLIFLSIRLARQNRATPWQELQLAHRRVMYPRVQAFQPDALEQAYKNQDLASVLSLSITRDHSLADIERALSVPTRMPEALDVTDKFYMTQNLATAKNRQILENRENCQFVLRQLLIRRPETSYAGPNFINYYRALSHALSVTSKNLSVMGQLSDPNLVTLLMAYSRDRVRLKHVNEPMERHIEQLYQQDMEHKMRYYFKRKTQ